MTGPSERRPAWVVPVLLVGLIAVAYLTVRVAARERDQPPFPTRSVPVPSAVATVGAPDVQAAGLVLAPDGVGPHRLGDPETDVLDGLSEALGPPTEDALEECGSGPPTRWVRWADFSVRLDSGRFVAFIEGINYPPGPPPLAIPTVEGLVPGDPAARLFELYAAEELSEVPAPGPADGDVTQYEVDPGDGGSALVVVIEGPPETGRVIAISAGSFCQSPA